MRVIIIGGGNVGTYIAGELTKADHDVLIVEIDPDRVLQGEKSGLPIGASWLNADGCEVTELAQARPETAEVVVAVTGDDEDNLVVSLLAKQEFGVPRVVARVNNPDNQWLFNESWGVDVSVSTPHLLTALVEEAVSVGSLVRLLSLGGDKARLSEVTLAPSSPANGRQIVDLGFPRDSTVVAVIRNENVVVPRGDTTLNSGDEVMVLVTSDSEDRVRRLLIGRLTGGPTPAIDSRSLIASDVPSATRSSYDPPMDFNLGVVNEAVAAAVPDREAIVAGDRRITYGELASRTRRLANALLERGCTIHHERDTLQGWETGQDHLALYLHNGPEYLEGMLGAYKARVAPFNVNYRYVEEELRYLLDDSGAKAIIYHSTFAPRLAAVLDDLPHLQVLLQVPDASGNDLLPGAEWYEDALASVHDREPDVTPSTDDLYILYTGGTTGMPKGVLWRQADIFPAALGGRQLGSGEEWTSIEEIVETARSGGAKLMPSPPFMHGAAHWLAFNAFTGGNTIVLPRNVETLDAADVWSTCEAEGVNIILIVGDAFGRPLLDELDRADHDLSQLLMLVSGGAALSAGVKQQFLAKLPSMGIMDGLGASETGQQGTQISGAGAEASTGTFTPGPGMCIVSEDLTRVLPPGDEETGWLAQQGRVPLGYLGDEAKTAKTFPVIDGNRYSVPGDRARVNAGGLLELYGRDSVTINSGGEKIFAEEVEAALAHHPAVYDVIVAGRPSERWGNEVVAVVQLREGFEASEADLLEECEKHVARYKLPKAFRFVDTMVRSPAGKADYRWAREQAVDA